jgi:hypothetical protein
MEMMPRRAYGFRNFENYRLRVLTHCGWDGIINRVVKTGASPFKWVEPYDLGFFDEEVGRIKPATNPFVPEL